MLALCSAHWSEGILLGRNNEEMKSRAFTSLYRSRQPVSSTWGHLYRIILMRLLSVPGANVFRFYLLVLDLSMAKQECSAQQMEPWSGKTQTLQCDFFSRRPKFGRCRQKPRHLNGLKRRNNGGQFDRRIRSSPWVYSEELEEVLE